MQWPGKGREERGEGSGGPSLPVWCVCMRDGDNRAARRDTGGGWVAVCDLAGDRQQDVCVYGGGRQCVL